MPAHSGHRLILLLDGFVITTARIAFAASIPLLADCFLDCPSLWSGYVANALPFPACLN